MLRTWSAWTFHLKPLSTMAFCSGWKRPARSRNPSYVIHGMLLLSFFFQHGRTVGLVVFMKETKLNYSKLWSAHMLYQQSRHIQYNLWQYLSNDKISLFSSYSFRAVAVGDENWWSNWRGMPISQILPKLSWWNRPKPSAICSYQYVSTCCDRFQASPP